MEADKFPRYSDMDFISDNAYVIEESSARLACGDGIRSVEFIRRKNMSLLFIEAKTTIANPENSPQPYEIEISEICEKFIHSLNLLSAVKLGIVADTLPDDFTKLDNTSLTFVLVVRKYKLEWCRPTRRAIEQALPTYLKKIWKPAVHVINHDTAIKHGIAIETKEATYGSTNPNRT
jgi:hypothetical protein